MIVRPLGLPSTSVISAAVGAPPLAVYRRVITIVLPSHGADALEIDGAGTALSASFARHDFPATIGVAELPGAAGTLVVTLDTPREVRRVQLAGKPEHRVSLLRLDANVPAATATVVAKNGADFAGPPGEFTDRRFAVRAHTSAGALDASLGASALQGITVRSRPGRPRFGLAVPGQEADAVTFWSAPVAAPAPDTVATAGIGPAFAQALREHLDGRQGPAGDPVTISLVVESDAPCALTLSALQVSYRLVRTGFAAPHHDAGKVVLEVARDTVEPVGVAVDLPARARIASATLATFERLPSERAQARDWVDLAADLDGVATGIRVVPGQPAAALVHAQAGLQVSRVALGLIALELPAELRVELFADLQGAPSGPALAGAEASIAVPCRQAWTAVRLPAVALCAGNPIWVTVSALRGTLVWLAPLQAAAPAREAVPVRAHDGAPVDGLAVLVELLGNPSSGAADGTAGESAVAPEALALSIAGVTVPSPPAVDGTRTFDIAAALDDHLATAPKSATVTAALDFRAVGPGNVTVYRPRIVYDVG